MHKVYKRNALGDDLANTLLYPMHHHIMELCALELYAKVVARVLLILKARSVTQL